MTSEEAEKYLNETHDYGAGTSPATEPGAEIPTNQAPEPDNVEPGRTSSDTAERTDDANGEPASDNAERQTESEPARNKQSHVERQRFAFRRQAEKMKRQREQYEAEIAELKKQLQDREGLQLKHFKNDNEAFLRHLAKQNADEARLENLVKAKADFDEQEAEAIREENARVHEERAARCFPDATERELYFRQLDRGFTGMWNVLQKNDSEGVVLDFIADSDNGPLLNSLFLSHGDLLQRVLNKQSKIGKLNELQKIENMAVQARRNQQKKAANPAKSLPVLGSQTKTMTAGDNVRDDNYWRAYLAAHPNG